MKFSDNPSVSTEKRSLLESVQWGEFEKFRNFNFKKADRFNIICYNLNDYIEEIRQKQQEHLENDGGVDSSSRKRKWVNFEEYDDNYDEDELAKVPLTETYVKQHLEYLLTFRTFTLNNIYSFPRN